MLALFVKIPTMYVYERSAVFPWIPNTLKISHFDPTRPRGSISTSAIHFIISKMVSAVRADATEVPIPQTKSSSTNGLAATVHQTIMLHYLQKNMLNPFLNPLTINGDICKFVTAVSALSNTSQRGSNTSTTTRVADTSHWATPGAASSSWFWHQSKAHMRLPIGHQWSSIVTLVLSCPVSQILQVSC